MNLIAPQIGIAVIVALVFVALIILRGLLLDEDLDRDQPTSDDEKDRRVMAERLTRAADFEIAHRKRVKAYPMKEVTK